MRKDIGMQWRRKGRVLEFYIDVNLNPKIAIKTFKATYEVERNLYLLKRKGSKP